MSKGIIYIAGPYRAETANGILLNIAAARMAATYWWQLGWAVICPHMNTAFMDGVVTDDEFLRGDLALLERCDAIGLMHNWYNSSGARSEAIHASECGIKLFVQEQNANSVYPFWFPVDYKYIKSIIEGTPQ